METIKTLEERENNLIQKGKEKGFVYWLAVSGRSIENGY